MRCTRKKELDEKRASLPIKSRTENFLKQKATKQKDIVNDGLVMI